jgi:outer membrane receptor protein involved in Fe transport
MRRPILLFALLVVVAVPGAGQPAVGTVAGRVVDNQAAPVAGAAVFIVDVAETESGSDGRFVLEGVPVGTHLVQVGASGFAVEALEVNVTAGASAEADFILIAAEIPLDEVVVTSSFSLLTDQPVAPMSLSREQILKIPHFADDLFRAIQVLPGVSSGDFSAAFSVRGGFFQEILVRLDGHEIFEPFHLRDFGGVFSAVDPEAVGGVDLMPGGFPSEYGDRMTAVLDMTTRGTSGAHGSVGISFSNAWINGGGGIGDKGRWMGSARRGYLDVLLAFLGDDDEDEGEDDEDPDPIYWDAFGKLDWDFGPRQTASFKFHFTDDDLIFEEDSPDEVTDVETGYDSSLVGLNHLTTIGSSGVVETLASVAGVGRDRDISSFEDDESLELLDLRDTEILSLRQSWNWQLGDRQLWKWGFELRSFDTDYEYFNEFEFDDRIDDPRFLPAAGLTQFSGSFSSDYLALYAADRFRLGERYTLEIGARWDDYELTDDSNLAPRVNLVVALPRSTVLRAGWGHFYQSQRTNELAVAFGETEFSGTQRAEHWTLGLEKLFDRGYTMRLDLYAREVEDPIVRYETLFDPLSPIPEVEEDRVQIAADSVEAYGAELYLRGPAGKRFSWWVTYAYSEVTDVLADRDQLRSNDQTHAVTWNSAYRLGQKWEFNWLWTWHTGWPTTSITGEVVFDPDEGQVIVEEVGPFYEERLPDYHRFDLRISRRSNIKKGTLTFFLDIQNLYDRLNVRGLDLDDTEIRPGPGGGLEVIYQDAEWLGIIPSFGVSWEF